ncbi:MAG: hypothetical protein IPM53_25260 [Anaerolineaceae bacterium]|nr:hypothetical protein [Anaerolineaceae bacterium]
MQLRHEKSIFRQVWRCGVRLLIALFLLSLFQGTTPSGKPVLAGGSTCSSNLNFGQTIHCAIDLAGETDSFTFSGSAGDRIRVRVVETSGSLAAFQEIIQPGGTSLCSTIVTEITCLLESNGNHTLLINDFGGTDNGNYSLYLQRLNNPVGCSTIAFGALPSTGNLTEAAVTDCFTFQLSTGDQVRGRAVETAGTAAAYQEIIQPDGTTLCGTIVTELTCQATVTGLHTILINDFGGTDTGTYSFYLQRLNNPVGCSSIGYSGLPVTGSIDVPAETDCYTFSGMVGNQIRVRAIKTSGSVAPYKAVIRPDGVSLCGTIVSEVTCLLDSDGNYTILINDFGGTDTGTYQLTLVCLTQPCGTPFSNFNYLPFVLRQD